MPQVLEFEVLEVSLDDTSSFGNQIYNIQVAYRGNVDLSGQILQGDNLSIEIPSHAPPPEK